MSVFKNIVHFESHELRQQHLECYSQGEVEIWEIIPGSQALFSVWSKCHVLAVGCSMFTLYKGGEVYFIGSLK